MSLKHHLVTHAQHAPWRAAIDIAIECRSKIGNWPAYAEPLVFKERNAENEGTPILPAMTLQIEEAQRLMDQLWDCGIRPTEGSGSAGAMRATERHLEDMQRIVTRLLDSALPEPITPQALQAMTDDELNRTAKSARMPINGVIR